MPMLVVEHSGKRKAGLLPHRMVIGRLPTVNLFINDSGVSRVHAWIERQGTLPDSSYIITDCGSLTGTEVNGQLMQEPTTLVDGDRIRIGGAKLLFRISEHLPADARETDFLPKGQDLAPTKVGVLFDCACGAPAWARFTDAGKAFLCRQCGQHVLIPSIPWARARIAPSGASQAGESDIPDAQIGDSTDGETQGALESGGGVAVATAPGTCSICQTAIGAEDRSTQCPECQLTFHADCWQQNFGCSSYGCSQVNVLKKADPQADAKAVDEISERFPWEYALLGAAVFALLAGALTFGIPPALAAIAGLAYLIFGKPRHRRVLVVVIALGLLGVLTGIFASYFWYYGVELWTKL